MREIGVGVIALGWMGRLHSRGFAQVGERYPELGVKARLVAAADPVEANQEAALALGFSRAVGDYADLLADPAIEAVSICAPNFLHHEIALAAIAAGKHFWIEKPMGVNASQSREIAQAAAAAGLTTATGFNYRHQPPVAHARDLVLSGTLGRITNARVWLIADYASSPDGPFTWRYTRAQAGAGVVGDLLSHGIDLAQFVLGTRVSSVTAMTDTFITDRPLPLGVGVGHSAVAVSDERRAVENEDYVAALARTESGALVTLESSRVAMGPRAEYVVEVYGTSGSVRWSFEHPQHLQVLIADAGTSHRGYTAVMSEAGHGDYGRFQPGPGMHLSFDDSKVIEARLFLESILTGRQLAPSAGDAWAAAEADEAIVASAADGAWHPVPVVTGTTFGA
ncbi:MAG: Gfo/Idh/MocA family oxidoreductase [Actinobacteria bacterium]|nr:Gfo/Idh/MocA family oxidoreductase [Actinomycetota bacterium]